MVDKIRKLDGFSNFLQAVPFRTLQTAAAAGPVIIVNISSDRCDAIIVIASGHPVLIPLPQASLSEFTQLSLGLSDETISDFTTYSILQKLWNEIVSPITDGLAALKITEGTQVWWCLTSVACALLLKEFCRLLHLLLHTNTICTHQSQIWCYTS